MIIIGGGTRRARGAIVPLDLGLPPSISLFALDRSDFYYLKQALKAF